MGSVCVGGGEYLSLKQMSSARPAPSLDDFASHYKVCGSHKARNEAAAAHVHVRIPRTVVVTSLTCDRIFAIYPVYAMEVLPVPPAHSAQQSYGQM